MYKKHLLLIQLIIALTCGGKAIYAGSYSLHVRFPVSKEDSLILFSYQFLGTPYKYAGTSPKGFDCSGFVYYVLTHHQVDVPRTSRDMGTVGRVIPMDSARPGDIILFKGTNANSKVIGHAGLVTWCDGKDVQFIHSSSNKKHGGVIMSCFSDSPSYKKPFVKVVRGL